MITSGRASVDDYCGQWNEGFGDKRCTAWCASFANDFACCWREAMLPAMVCCGMVWFSRGGAWLLFA